MAVVEPIRTASLELRAALEEPDEVSAEQLETGYIQDIPASEAMSQLLLLKDRRWSPNDRRRDENIFASHPKSLDNPYDILMSCRLYFGWSQCSGVRSS